MESTCECGIELPDFISHRYSKGLYVVNLLFKLLNSVQRDTKTYSLYDVIAFVKDFHGTLMPSPFEGGRHKGLIARTGAFLVSPPHICSMQMST